MKFHNIIDFAAAVFNIERSSQSQVAIAESAGQRLYRASPRGLGIAPLGATGATARGLEPVWGIKLTGIVEGTDIESVSKPLMFPFSEDEFWAQAEALNASLDEAEAEWNAQE